MKIIDFNGFLRWVTKRHGEDHGLDRWRVERYGQAFFNVLSLAKPGLAEHLRGHLLDPFHFETVRPEVLAWLERNWDTPDHDDLLWGASSNKQSLDSLPSSE
jgi:hypothetical protein